MRGLVGVLIGVVLVLGAYLLFLEEEEVAAYWLLAAGTASALAAATRRPYRSAALGSALTIVTCVVAAGAFLLFVLPGG